MTQTRADRPATAFEQVMWGGKPTPGRVLSQWALGLVPLLAVGIHGMITNPDVAPQQPAPLAVEVQR